MNETQVTTVNEVDNTPKRGWRNRSHSPRKHRIQDYVACLERDLALAQQLNETLSANLTAQIAETTAANERFDKLTQRVEDLDRRLRVAEEANVANANGVDFYFQQRQITGPEDQATMPVPQVQLLDDGSSLKIVATDAATALLDRITPRREPEERLVPIFAPPVPVETPHLTVVPDVETPEETELYNAIDAGWRMRRPQPHPPVTWGSGPSQAPTLRTNMSTTGTYMVVPLHQRGTGPTAVPGVAL